MTSQIEHSSITDTIRRMLRVLGAMPAHAGNPEAVERAARFVHDRLTRNQNRVAWFDPLDLSPLVVAGSGPVLLVTYMDDADPYASSHSGQPPAIRDSFISGPGIIRKAGVIAAVAAQLHPDFEHHYTLVIETDRNQGSRALEEWLKTQPPRFSAGIWEATDLPLVGPAIIHSAPGRLTLHIAAQANHHFAESHFGGAVTDLGRALAQTLGELVTEDHEVRLDGFYDGITLTDGPTMTTIAEMEGRTQAWLHRIAPGEISMSAAHVTLGVYMAPGAIVRELSLTDPNPYLPVSAEAVVEFHLVPGQDVRAITQSAIEYFKARLPGVHVDILLVRPPVVGKANVAALRETHPQVLATVPSISPAGVIESFGIPTVGYASVGRNPENTSGRVTLEETLNGARLIQALTRRMSGEPTPSGE